MLVKAFLEDNPRAGQRSSLLPTTQEEQEGSKGCPWDIYQLCSLHGFVSPPVFTRATPTW